MLDEKLEVSEYNLVFKEDVKKCKFRLKYPTLRYGLSGLNRALNTIARDKLFSLGTVDIPASKKYLLEWLKELEKSSALQSILYSNKGKRKAKADEIEMDLESLIKRLEKPESMYKRLNIDQNDVNRISLDQIIACALNDGELKKYCLVAKKDFFKGDYLWLDGRNKSHKVNKSNKDFLLKATSAYILGNTLNQQYVTITDSDVRNWCYTDHRYERVYFTKTNEIVFATLPVFNNSSNIIKYSFNKNWIDNFSTVEFNNTDDLYKWHNEHSEWNYYYIDKGSAEPLEQHEFKKNA